MIYRKNIFCFVNGNIIICIFKYKARMTEEEIKIIINKNFNFVIFSKFLRNLRFSLSCLYVLI